MRLSVAEPCDDGGTPQAPPDDRVAPSGNDWATTASVGARGTNSAHSTSRGKSSGHDVGVDTGKEMPFRARFGGGGALFGRVVLCAAGRSIFSSQRGFS